jgi:Uncharacterised nucleotidyltransferase
VRRLNQTRRPLCWPSPQQELLLRAALLPGPEAIVEWEQWKRSTDPVPAEAAVDPASNRLLPLLYLNLRRQGVEPRQLQSYRAAYERAWCENQLIFSHAAALARELQSENIPCILLKGVALAYLFYADPATRPMTDFDVLVHPRQITAASAICSRLGWQPLFDPQDLLPLDQSAHFRRNSKFQLDLHWRVFWQYRGDLQDEELWVQTLPLAVAGVNAQALNATLQLLHVCVHGTQWCEEPSIRWVADALAILRSEHFPLDWEALAHQAAKRRYALPMLDTLQYLLLALDAPVPPRILEDLRKTPATLFDKISYRAVSSGNEALRTLLWWQVVAPLRDGSLVPLRERIAILLRYMKAKWGVRSLWSLPFSAIAKLGRKATQGVLAMLSAKPAHPEPRGLNRT